MSKLAGPLDVADLYARYGRLVTHRVQRFFSGDEVQEVVQEVFLRVLDQASSFRGASSPATWLFQVTTRHCLNRLRDAGRRRALWEAHGPPDWGAPTSPAVQESHTLLAQVWRQLDPEQLQIAVLFHLDGLSHREIARVVGLSARTVGNRLAQITALARAHAGLPTQGGPDGDE